MTLDTTRRDPRQAAGRARETVPPIWFRGAPLSAGKVFTGGTHRTRPPEETFEWIRPHLSTAGITRLADITGLDRIGIHTVVGFRPNARTLSSSAGKGFSLAAARVSAAMEGIELYHAENLRLPETTAPYDEMAAAGPIVPLDQLPLAKASLFSPRRPETWVHGWDLVNQREAALPHASVSMVRHHAQAPRHSLPFTIDSNGLASGNHLLEAACAGLYEKIERDAVTCHLLAEFRTRHRAPRVRLDEIRHPLVVDLLERLRAARVMPLLYDCTVDTEVPVYLAYVYDEENRNVGMGGGAGAHLDPAVAMIRALTEAVQSRLVYISGARDDMFRNDDTQYKVRDTTATLERMTSVPETAAPREGRAYDTFQEDMAELLRRLGRVGLGEVYLVDLTHEEVGIPVVRMFVPGLEGYASNLYTAGPRARAFCESVADR